MVCVFGLGEFNAPRIEVGEREARVPSDFEQDCELGVGEVPGRAFAKQGDASQRAVVVRERGRSAKVDALRFHPFAIDGRGVASLDVDEVEVAVDADLM